MHTHHRPVLRVEEVLVEHQVVDKEKAVVNTTPAPINQEVVIIIDTIEHKGVTTAFGRIASIEHRATRLYLGAQQRLPIGVGVLAARHNIRRRAITEVFVERHHIGHRTRICCGIFCLKGVTEVGHNCCHGSGLLCVILTLDIGVEHTIPIVCVVQVTRRDIDTLQRRGIGRRYALSPLGPAVVVHNDSH